MNILKQNFSQKTGIRMESTLIGNYMRFLETIESLLENHLTTKSSKRERITEKRGGSN